MTKIPENKTRKRLRIVLCTLYLFEIFMCSMPYYQYISDNKLFSYSVFEMLAALGTGNTIGLPDAGYRGGHRCRGEGADSAERL